MPALKFVGCCVIQRAAVVAVVMAATMLVDGVASCAEPLRITWEKGLLTISGHDLPGGEITINYLEAYCRAGSTDADWSNTAPT